MVAVQNIKLVEKVDQLAKAKGVESGQLALAWVHSQVLHINTIVHFTRHAKIIMLNCFVSTGTSVNK